MDVSKGSRSASTSITLTVVDGNPPAVWVGQSMKVKSSDSVTLEGFYTTSIQPTNAEWSSSAAQGVLEWFFFFCLVCFDLFYFILCKSNSTYK